MSEIHSPEGVWDFDPTREIQHSTSASDLSKKFHEGIVVTLASKEHNITKYVRIKAHFPSDQEKPVDSEPWRDTANKTQVAFENFVKEVVESGILDPLLSNKPIENLPIKKLELLFSQNKEALEYDKHQYFEDVESKHSIEKQEDPLHQKIATSLHTDDKSKNFSAIAQQVSRIQESVIKQKKLKIKDEEVLKEALTCKDEEALNKLLIEHGYTCHDPLVLIKQLSEDKPFLKQKLEPLIANFVILRLLDGRDEDKLLNNPTIKDFVDQKLTNSLTEDETIKALALATHHELPLLKSKAEEQLLDLDAQKTCQQVIISPIHQNQETEKQLGDTLVLNFYKRLEDSLEEALQWCQELLQSQNIPESVKEKLYNTLYEVIEDTPEMQERGEYPGALLPAPQDLVLANQQRVDGIEQELSDILTNWSSFLSLRNKSYVQEVAHCMHQYQKNRRSKTADPNSIKPLHDLQQAFLSGNALQDIPPEDRPFFQSLFSQDYRLDYFEGTNEPHTAELQNKGSLEAIEISYTVPGNKSILSAAPDGNCALNSFVMNMIGLIYQGRYPEDKFCEILSKTDNLQDNGQPCLEKYNDLKAKYTDEGKAPFHKIFESPTLEGANELQKNLNLYFRNVLVFYYANKIEDNQSYLEHNLFSNIEFNKDSPELQIDKTTPHQVASFAEAMNEQLFTYFKTAAYASVQAQDSSATSMGDLFDYAKHLPEEAMALGAEWLSSIEAEELKKLDELQAHEKQTKIDEWLKQNRSDFTNLWAKFLKKAYNGYLHSISQDSIWLQGHDIATLTELFSTPELQLNAVISYPITYRRGFNSRMAKDKFGKIPDLHSLQEAELNFLRYHDLIAHGYLVNTTRQNLIRLFEEQIQQGLSSDLATGLLKEASDKDIIDRMKNLKKRLLHYYDKLYLTEGMGHKKPKIVTIGFYNTGAHFDYMVNSCGRFDLTSQNSDTQSSFDELDRWEQLYQEARDVKEDKVALKEMLGKISHKIFSMGGEENTPQILLDERNRILLAIQGSV